MANETKFTPGEWSIEQDSTNGFELTCGDERSYSITLNHLDVDGEDEANAQLIVASPALFAACQTALTVIDEQLGEWLSVVAPYAPEWTTPLQEARHEINAAIEKATGNKATAEEVR